MRTLTFTLAPGQTRPFDVAGAYFEILRASFEIERIDLTADNGAFGDPLEGVTEGVYVNQKYTGFVVKNGPTAQTVKLLIGKENGGNRAAPLTGTVAISNTSGAFTHVQPAVTNAAGGVVLLAANAARRLLIVQNNSTAGVLWVRLDGGVPVAGVGIKLEPGEPLNLETFAPTGAIRAIGDIANNPDVSVTEG